MSDRAVDFFFERFDEELMEHAQAFGFFEIVIERLDEDSDDALVSFIFSTPAGELVFEDVYTESDLLASLRDDTPYSWNLEQVRRLADEASDSEGEQLMGWGDIVSHDRSLREGNVIRSGM